MQPALAVVPIASVTKTPDHVIFTAVHEPRHAQIKSFLMSRPLGKVLSITSDAGNIMVSLNQGQVANFGLHLPPTLNMGVLYACGTGTMYFHPHLDEDNAASECFMTYLGFPTLKILCDIRFIEASVRAEKTSKLNPVYISIFNQIATRLSGMSISNTGSFYAACLYVSPSLDVFIKDRCCGPAIFEQLHAKLAGLFAGPELTVRQKSLCSHKNDADSPCPNLTTKNSDACVQHQQSPTRSVGLFHSQSECQPDQETASNESDEESLYNILLNSLHQKTFQQFEFLANHFKIATNHGLLLRLANGMRTEPGVNIDVIVDILMSRADNDTLLCLLKTLCK
jgi:hypothetical protein